MTSRNPAIEAIIIKDNNPTTGCPRHQHHHRITMTPDHHTSLIILSYISFVGANCSRISHTSLPTRLIFNRGIVNAKRRKEPLRLYVQSEHLPLHAPELVQRVTVSYRLPHPYRLPSRFLRQGALLPPCPPSVTLPGHQPLDGHCAVPTGLLQVLHWPHHGVLQAVPVLTRPPLAPPRVLGVGQAAVADACRPDHIGSRWGPSRFHLKTLLHMGAHSAERC